MNKNFVIMRILQVWNNAVPKCSSEIKEKQQYGKNFKCCGQQNSFRIPLRIVQILHYLTKLANQKPL